MSWLRLDDTFAQHPKITHLSRGDRWTWLEILLYCARFKTAGVVPETVGEVVKRATPAFLNRCYELHLLDLDGEEYRVHDWDAYNPSDATAADRMRRYRKRNADRNADRNGDGASRAGARARPVPSPSLEPPSVPSVAHYAEREREAKPGNGAAGDLSLIKAADELERLLADEARREAGR